MSIAQLGDLQFRLHPSQVHWSYDVDTTVVPTLGGRVVQVYGVTVSDMVVQGLFGQDRSNDRESWELAEEFHQRIVTMIDQQVAQPKPSQLDATRPETATEWHQPFQFIYNDDDPDRRANGESIHDWRFSVYIKDFKDAFNPEYPIEHKTGKFSYSYQLTLFITEDHTGKLEYAAQDAFLERLTDALGWKRTAFNGPMTNEELEKFLKEVSPDDPTLHGYVLRQFHEAGAGTVPEKLNYQKPPAQPAQAPPPGQPQAPTAPGPGGPLANVPSSPSTTPPRAPGPGGPLAQKP